MEVRVDDGVIRDAGLCVQAYHSRCADQIAHARAHPDAVCMEKKKRGASSNGRDFFSQRFCAARALIVPSLSALPGVSYFSSNTGLQCPR